MKQKSLQRPPTIRFTDSVLRMGFLIIMLRFGSGGGDGGGGGGGDFNISPNSKICPRNAPYYRFYKQYGLDSRFYWKILFSVNDLTSILGANIVNSFGTRLLKYYLQTMDRPIVVSKYL